MRSLLLVLVLGSVAQADERYYMIVYGYQTTPNLPGTSHTFAVFAKVMDKQVIEIQPISWMPKSLVVDPLHVVPETGINLTIPQSFALAKTVGASVTKYGPFQINKLLYGMAIDQRGKLESAAVKYVCLDPPYRGSGATNCTHAVSDLDTTQGPLITGSARGWSASLLVVEHFRKHIIDTSENMGWLLGQLEPE